MKPDTKKKERTAPRKLDVNTVDCLLRFCKEEQAGTHSRMVAASWGEVIEKLTEWKENNCKINIEADKKC